MGKNDRVQLPVAQRAKIRQRPLALFFRMHPAVEHEALTRRFEVIRICADLSPAGEIDELHENDETRMTNDE